MNLVNEQIEVPQSVDLERSCWGKVRVIVCGGGHTLLLDNEGNLYSCGWNHKLQSGLISETHYFQRVWQLSGIKFINIACGWDFSCGVTDDKFLFVWGSNSHGQLGLPREHFDEYVKPIRLQVNACAVSMGLRHTAITNSKGEVWVTGYGRHGQLGLGKNRLETDRFEQVPKVGNISHIACGQNHTIAWSSVEKVLYVWGDNKHGQLILQTEKYNKIFEPQKIDIDVKQEVKKLLSGWTNALLWLEDGKILTWGRNTYGQLGCRETHPEKLNQVILPENRQVKDISLGSEHTVCLATDNTLWAWGWNEHSNTGTGQGDAVYEPTIIPLVLNNNEIITRIFTGGGHNFVVIDNNNELQKGSNSISEVS